MSESGERPIATGRGSCRVACGQSRERPGRLLPATCSASWWRRNATVRRRVALAFQVERGGARAVR